MKDIREFNADSFTLFDRGWALVTAGSQGDWNTMTISWGQLGTLWRRPIATVFVKPVRYTHEFMDRSEYFTVSFYPEQYRSALTLLGSKSGRDCDKVALAGLTPLPLEHGMTFKEASATLVCRKIFRQDIDIANVPDFAISEYYQAEAPHTIYIGEVLQLIEGGQA